MSEPPEMRVVTCSSIFGDTPEGMYRMDRLERRAKQEREDFRAKYGDRAVEILDEIDEKLERAILFGEGA